MTNSAESTSLSQGQLQKGRLFIAGTCSDAGKSIITAGLCRIFKQDGLHPAPYKAQNMSLNSYATPEGLEIGRAQAVQAEACGIPCHTDMNPVLLKPTGDLNSQVILNGKPVGNRSAREYYNSEHQKPLFDKAYEAFERLAARYYPIVMEGAGSISELNLRHRDIVNMPMALRVGASVILVTDIERGGVFASVYGSIMLLPPQERALVKGVIVNKFRGDISLFDEGRRILEEITGVPVLGIVPWFNHIHIEEEDSVSLSRKCKTAVDGRLNVCVVALPRMSNFTDFNVLQRIDGVNLYFSADAAQLQRADVIILPGSKNTIGDLMFLHENQLGDVILQARRQGRSVVGICGGYQMMGRMVHDPHGVEGDVTQCPGLGLLPMDTTLEKEKTTRQTEFRFRGSEAVCRGYEIHMGISRVDAFQEPLTMTPDGHRDGVWMDERCWGSYMHGILDNAAVLQSLLSPYGIDLTGLEDDYTYKERQYNLLADHLRGCLDLDAIYRMIQ
ncbi:adenosylcobyric acid synthase (glutamine-hydrolysing) [Breznakibacter xylanolyticus]|uniref:Cobyric acid synthase n=1 Tax=Breznakibacter xylanolyticus TaxID=990 RepID=A0A2W7PAQ2_9BACT|nr:cobyric acid synthase [Breznakibacter xylanolyticus]PZX20382.1 adenosylcobyric acid synthase (glutamine-hydrolysing) [Breznakibacter xylanolyticus]